MTFAEKIEGLIERNKLVFKSKKAKATFVKSLIEASMDETSKEQPDPVLVPTAGKPLSKPEVNAELNNRQKIRKGINEIVKDAKPVGHAVMTPGLSQKADDLVKAKYGLG